MLHTFSCCDRFTKSTLFMSFVSDCLVLLSGPSLVPSSSLWKWPSIISYVIFGDCLISVTPIFRTSLLLSIVCLILFMIDHWDWLIQPSTPIPSFYMMCSTTAPSWLTVLLLQLCLWMEAPQNLYWTRFNFCQLLAWCPGIPCTQQHYTSWWRPFCLLCITHISHIYKFMLPILSFYPNVILLLM